jgi:hypothetical protein
MYVLGTARVSAFIYCIRLPAHEKNRDERTHKASLCTIKWSKRMDSPCTKASSPFDSSTCGTYLSLYRKDRRRKRASTLSMLQEWPLIPYMRSFSVFFDMKENALNHCSMLSDVVAIFKIQSEKRDGCEPPLPRASNDHKSGDLQ